MSAATIYAASRADVEAVLAFLDELDEPTRLRVLHEAYERRYRVELLDALAANLAAPPPVTTRPRHQVVFCIDDRFESSRRHLEELAPECETLGAAGFFGLAIAYQGIDDPSTFPLCPVVVQPQHRIEEQALTRQFSIAELRASRRRQLGEIETAWGRMSRSLLLGSIVTAIAGFFAAIPLLANVFSPRAAGRVRKAIARWWLPEPMTRLTELRAEQDGTRTAQVMSGFTLDEMATRVAALLENMGIVHRFGKLVVVLGHDSSSVNNPYFPAYSCGACGGRSGGPNARLFARMANQPGVRERLAARGIAIPEDTVFVGGLYDTANDMIRLYDAEDLPDAALHELRVLSPQLEEMCRRNAHERCRRFASAPRRAAPERALRHVEGRAFDLAQARPELGHATNAACFVGRRELTAGLFLDRRAFLVSYDPEQDPKGSILERILLAVGPVGAGINLEYFFSTVDMERLGAGTKLPHNVTGLFGVMNGASSDLRTGLPKQMTEIHEPVRLHLVVEASPATLLAIAGRQPAVAELVTNEWLRLISVDPETRAIQTFDARFGFRPYTPLSAGLPRVRSSSDWYAGRDQFLPPALIRP
ncbi:putative inorganic carbon transporter subunit DabA [Nannocystis pusilla]|uniref:putative inorganic carbon transporter subunit DabA n=1 Tax=Nannocystis pusilla TaxID=889268 RepID=UPI003B7A76E5